LESNIESVVGFLFVVIVARDPGRVDFALIVACGRCADYGIRGRPAKCVDPVR
jgi:hypothetical protein